MHGGDLVAEVLKAQGTPFIFTLCGGHISPILVGCKQRGIRVIDTRHEATAVFAADAVARLTGRPGVVAVTAGPGLTNSLTALKNAQMAQSPLVLIGGAAPTALQGRGALQDIDQMAVIRPHVKWAGKVRRVKNLIPVLETAFRIAQEGIPGPVFVETPIDLLYDEALVRKWYGADRGGRTLGDKAVRFYLNYHVNRLFAGSSGLKAGPPVKVRSPQPESGLIRLAADRLMNAQRPLILVGSQALIDVSHVEQLATALERIGAPVYLSGMARGLLGGQHPLQMRHKRREALREADLVMLAGLPADFRLDYGNHIRRSAFYIAANRSRADMNRNRRPNLSILGDPALALQGIASALPDGERWSDWRRQLRQRDEARTAEIAQQVLEQTGKVNPLHLCKEVERAAPVNSIFVGDGGDFVATASYVVQPTGPLHWMDPGVFGTLGVGAGFALGAKLVHPDAQVWILYGDGSVGYSLSEFDTFVRHNIPVIAVVGNDASWSQIAREQIELLHDDVGTVLAHTDYDRVAQGFGGAGLRVEDPELIADGLAQAKAIATAGKPVLVNVILAKTDFRKGSISM
jgi:acetolactate synthase-like protein